MADGILGRGDFLFGFCDLAFSESAFRQIDYRKTSQLISNLGAKAVRNWMQSSWLMDKPGVFKKNNVALMHAIVDDLFARGFLIIGMNHTNFHETKAGATPNDLAKLHPNDPHFFRWLSDVELTYYSLAKEFPNISYWEIDNEDNSDVFCFANDGAKMPFEEKIAVYLPFLYYASRGIHRANPKNKTVLGGLVTADAESFLTALYLAIQASPLSKNPDDYFEVANWHPYLDKYSDETFFELNEKIHQVVLRYDRSKKDVIFSELGWSEYNVSLENMALFIQEMYSLVQKKMPYVKNIDYFRLFDELDTTWGSPAEKIYGLFSDPSPRGNSPTKGCPKSGAYAYQKTASGKGPLNLMED
jgi:hypothetical protein